MGSLTLYVLAPGLAAPTTVTGLEAGAPLTLEERLDVGALAGLETEVPALTVRAGTVIILVGLGPAVA